MAVESYLMRIAYLALILSLAACTKQNPNVCCTDTADCAAQGLPRFTNTANGDFHLLVGSPAIDAADPAAIEAVDFDGTPRPQGPRRDIGAFEYKP